MKIAFIVGARPNFIKLAPIFDIIGRYKEIEPVIVHTGQHYDNNMSEIFFAELNIPKPDYHFKISTSTQTKQTSEIMNKLEDLFIKLKPDTVVVIGDVNSTMAGALVASKLNIKLAHIEAGLRSFNKTMPEEINRIVTDHISDVLFAPSQTAMNNLEKEGLSDKSHFTGDLMYDAVLRNFPISEKNSNILNQLNIVEKNYILVTLHRPYNVDEPQNLKSIINELSKLEFKIVFPIHPRTRTILKENNIVISSNIINIEPVGYIDSLMLQKNSYKVITDSGGMQKEAFFLKTPCLTLRPETEWVETIECGANNLVNIEKLLNLIEKPCEKILLNSDFYGDGKSAEKILNFLTKKNI